MPGQKSIVNFFKPVAVKRALTTFEGNVDQVLPDKKPKVEVLPDKKPKVEAQSNNKDLESPTSVAVNGDEAAASPPNYKSPFFSKYIQAKIKLGAKKYPALHPNIGESWFEALSAEFSKPYFQKLSEFLVTERAANKVFPPEEQVWTWTHFCPISKVKVVILGQDPYHNPGQAHGLCFSVPPGVSPPPSLLNMYQELSRDIPGFERPKHGYLIGWARQGVLLLNACLTVRAHNANSHKDKGWEHLTDAVVKYISNNCKGVVFLLWGSYAQKKASSVDKKRHHLLMSTHPSPLSAHRGFLGCGHFSRCNELLKEQGKTPINWGELPIN